MFASYFGMLLAVQWYLFIWNIVKRLFVTKYLWQFILRMFIKMWELKNLLAWPKAKAKVS